MREPARLLAERPVQDLPPQTIRLPGALCAKTTRPSRCCRCVRFRSHPKTLPALLARRDMEETVPEPPTAPTKRAGCPRALVYETPAASPAGPVRVHPRAVRCRATTRARDDSA